jgi:RND family efflux transporter MFP subunit
MRKMWIFGGIAGVAIILFVLFNWMSGDTGAESRNEQGGPAPVAVAEVQKGTIQLKRTFSGTLESPSKFVVAPKIDGRIVNLAVDVSDTVRRGQIVARLDSAEYEQAVAQSQAELSLANANLTEARNSYVIAERELERMGRLHREGITSESQLDTARADHLTKQSAVAVAEAQVKRAQASLAAAQIRLGYTKIPATWTGGDDLRVVSERLVNEGDTVSSNTPLVSIVELDPIQAIVFVTEKDYAHLKPGQTVSLKTDAFGNRSFGGTITRIAPVFRQASRQARVELTASNPRHELKPGMFVRVEVVLDTVNNATIVPEAALTTRNDQTGVFVLNPDGKTVSWRSVQPGIRENDRVEIQGGGGISGHVVVLGQQLVDDGSSVSISKADSVKEKAE